MKILALNGSLRAASANLVVLRHMQLHALDPINFQIFHDLGLVPPFNPDLDIEPAPSAVELIRTQINQADVLLICTPEYTFSIPGSLKNVLDWLVSSGTLYEKRIVLVATSISGGAKVLAALGDVMSGHQANVIAQASLHPAHVKADLGGPDAALSGCGIALETVLRAIAAVAKA